MLRMPARFLPEQSVTGSRAACVQGDADSQQRSDTAGDAHNTYIWGTRLVIADMQAKIRRFLRDFKREGTSNALYVTLITQVGLSGLQQCRGIRDKLVRRITAEPFSQLVASGHSLHSRHGRSSGSCWCR